jgi:hypothetical protein
MLVLCVDNKHFQMAGHPTENNRAGTVSEVKSTFNSWMYRWIDDTKLVPSKVVFNSNKHENQHLNMCNGFMKPLPVLGFIDFNV